MKRIYLTMLCWLMALVIYGQDTDKNYIKTYTAREEITGSLKSNTDIHQVQQSVQYVDGLGRPLQSIVRQASPGLSGNRDIVTHFIYDDYGRQLKQYLPMKSTNNNLSFVDNFLIDQSAFYNNHFTGTSEGSYAFSESQLEASPLNRVKKQAAPGQTWSVDGDHTVDMIYRNNTVADDVRKIILIADSITAAADYPAGELMVVITTDENTGINEGETQEFTDKLGRVILKKVKSGANSFYKTYYIYDDYGNLTYVVPPEAVVRIENANDWTKLEDDVFRQKWMFCYQYDGRNRMIAKRVPGSDWMYMIYDQRDRLVLTQDGNQREGGVEIVNGELTISRYEGKSYQLNTGARLKIQPGTGKFKFSSSPGKSFKVSFDPVEQTKKWIFTKYDELDRPVMTGFYYDSDSVHVIRAKVNDSSDFDVSYTGTGELEGYENTAFPPNVTVEDLLSVTYYDNYDFTDEVAPDDSWEVVDGQQVLLDMKGQVTGAKTRILGTCDWLESVTFYDSRYRPVKIITDNHKNGQDIVVSRYRNKVSALVDTTIMTHTSSDYAGALVVTEVFTYDHMDRLLKQTHSIDGATPVALVENTYNDLSELSQKKIGNNIQQVDYAYNIRGWLTSINNGAVLTGTDQFGMELQYDIAGQYNGNIGKMIWASKGGSNVNSSTQEFNYTYDALSRLKTASYLTNSTNFDNGGFDVGGNDNGGIAYDANGNILHLHRYQERFNGSPTKIDDLFYHYANGNQLSAVKDSATVNKSEGFYDLNPETETDYLYDPNGNMIKDENKDIVSISYNHLNLPERVSFGDGRYVQYLYDAAGIKLQKEAKDSVGTITVTNYIAGGSAFRKHYKNGNLEFFQHAEGRVVKNGSSFNYEYNLTDHLGNVRVTVDQGGTVVQRDDYYPFGLTFNSWSPSRNGGENQYKYTDKEYQPETNWIDFGARMQSPELGRWFNIDPLAEVYHDVSPYNFTLNNPIINIDPDGRSVQQVEGGTRYTGQDAQYVFAGLQKRYGGNGPAGYVKGDCKCSFLGSDGNGYTEFSDELELLSLRWDAGLDWGAAGYSILDGTIGAAKRKFDDLNTLRSTSDFIDWVVPLTGWGSIGQGSIVRRYDPDIRLNNEELFGAMAPLIFTKKGLKLKSIRGQSIGDNATAIGRMKTLKKFDNISNIDTWHKSGRIPGKGDSPVTWAENRMWLQKRIDRGDSFIMTMNPNKLPTKYVPGKPNGWFTKLEYDYLIKKGARIIYDY